MKRAASDAAFDVLATCTRPWRALGASLLIGVTAAAVCPFVVPRATAEAFGYLLLVGALFLFVMRAIAREPSTVVALRSVALPVASSRAIAASLVGLTLLGAGLQQLMTHARGILRPPQLALHTLSGVELPLVLPAVLVFAPIAEELAFRYGIQRRLQRHFNVPFAIVLTSAHFAALHGLNPFVFGAMFFLGCVTGALAATLGYVAFPVALHLGWNLAAFVGMPR